MKWNLHKVKGSRESVKSQVVAAKLPPAAEAFINAQIDGLTNPVAVILSTYCQDTAAPSKNSKLQHIQVTIESIEL
jgi:hypothetical protein